MDVRRAGCGTARGGGAPPVGAPQVALEPDIVQSANARSVRPAAVWQYVYAIVRELYELAMSQRARCSEDHGMDP